MNEILNGKHKAKIPLLCAAALALALLVLLISADRTLTASDGASYEIAVTYSASARIPAGASLEVSELSGARYQSYYARAVAELGHFESMRAFDIRCLAPDGTEIEPSASVNVAFRMPGIRAGRVLHFVDGGGVTAPSPRKSGGGALNIETDSFSVYAVVETETESAPAPLAVSEKFVDFTTDLFPVYFLEGEEPGEEPEQGGESVEEALKKELTSLEGNWATWTVDVNSGEHTLNDGKSLTLTDTFTKGQSIDYSSISVTEHVSTHTQESGAGTEEPDADTQESGTERVTYDYRGNTGTYVIPDKTHVTITYRTLIAVENVTFGNTAVLTKKDSGETVATVTLSETRTIYPSASEAVDNAGIYMLRLFVYGEGNMRKGIPGAQFILLDENQRPMTFKQGDNLGDPVTFTTDENGYADIQLDEKSGNGPIQKNTSYYLEMIQAPKGFKKDNTLYNFMITDNANYDSGGIWTYRNRDILKVRLHKEAPGLNVCMRFSGNYALRDDQRNAIAVILQKWTEENNAWEEVARHTVSEFSYGSFTFAGDLLEVGEIYRVIEENERPWDLPDIINLTTSYYLVIGSGTSDPYPDPPEFEVTEENHDSSFNIIISNEYDEHKLTITKMEKETGHRLSGAVFTVKKAANDAEVTTYTTDNDGKLTITGGAEYESDTLYYVVETAAPEHYLLPLSPPKIYFYFCNDEDLLPDILSSLPAGETAVNLLETYDSKTLDNQSKTRTIPVMQIWEDNTWPDNVDSVVIGLYQSVNGEGPRPVTYQDNGTPQTVTLRRAAPYNPRAFTNLPTRDEENHTITYSVKEEHIYTASNEDILERYVQRYGVSGSGVYVIRNKEATSLTVVKEWLDFLGQAITEESTLAFRSNITFDVYRSTTPAFEGNPVDEITNATMTDFVSDPNIKKVRDGLSFGHLDGWTMTIKDLERKDDAGNPYYYYVLETVPSFGDEVYKLDNNTITIRNKDLPETTTLTVQKNQLVNDPRPEAVNTEFGFTLALKKDTHPIRDYPVYQNDGLTLKTDWNGKAYFKLKPENFIELTLPVGVTATVTETPNPQYRETAQSDNATEDLDTASENVFSYDVALPVTITFTNTLRVICKVTDAEGDHPYESLQSALTYIRSKPDTFQGTATIQMLEDYSMPATDVFDIQVGENITLTTADVDENMQFHFQTDREENNTTAIITRAEDGGSLLKNAGTLTLENVFLDGAKESFTVASDGGIVNNTGILNLNNGATLRNSKTSGKGGAIHSTGTVNMIDGAAITGNAAASGSAIYLAGGFLNMTGGQITDNVETSDGAVTVEDTEIAINLSGSPVIYSNTNKRGYPANLYIGADSDNILNVVDPGLYSNAQIGVTAMETHREIAEQFGVAEYGMTENLNRFINDLYDYRAKLKEGTSTNIVWDGLTLTVKNVVAPLGANPNDTFTLTLSSTSIRKSNYTIDGTLNYSVTAAKRTIPGKIVLRNLTNADEIRISPLPVGDYTITETASNYTPEYAGIESVTSQTIEIVDGRFSLVENSALTVTHTRRLAQVKLKKTLFDPLSRDTPVNFPFTLTLTEVDGTHVSDFPLTDTLTTSTDGVVSTQLSPKYNEPVELSFRAPVGATLNITEAPNTDYQITASGRTMPAEGEGIDIGNTASGNVFAFPVTDDGASVTFANKRKMTEIELRKELVNKVSTAEKFEFTVTLTNENGTNAANYPIYYVDAEHPENNVSTDENGTAVIPFDFPDSVTSQSILLNVPDGTKLTVTETEVKKTIGTSEQKIYDTQYSFDGVNFTNGTTATINRVTENDKSIVFTNTRKTNTITVTNTVTGYSGNTVPFTFTATVTDGDEGQDAYSSNGFTNGVQTFELATGQQKMLTVPYGANLKVAETFIVGYETKVDNKLEREKKFQVTSDKTLQFTNTQLIKLVLDNQCSSEFTDVKVNVNKSNIMYRVNDDGHGQTPVTLTNRTATVNVGAGKTILLVSYDANQTYTVSGNSTPADGYRYTIVNEPAYHEDAKPAIMRVYNTGSFSVKGNLRYGPADSTITFSEQPLVSYDVNGGAWTTEMEGYHDRDGDRKIYQYAVNVGETVSQPTPNPVYTASGVNFVHWTQDLNNPTPYDFDTPVTQPVTLYAVWTNVESGKRIVTVKNGVNEPLTVTVTITNSDDTAPEPFTLDPGDTQSLTVSDGAKLELQAEPDKYSGYSTEFENEFENASNEDGKFTINSVTQSGTVAFISGVCKITDADGHTLYKADGDPAVYMKLSDAFTAYNWTLYTTAEHTTSAAPDAVKMLVDEYTIQQNTAISFPSFPSVAMKLTTATHNDEAFPYVGARTRATIYRYQGENSDSCFTMPSGNVTLENIILDGGSELKEAKTSAGLITVTGGTLNINEGAILRNSNTNADYGGAIYVNSNGTLNINAGTFSNLRAKQGGAIAATGTAVLNLTGTDGGTRFENCVAETEDGGAIYYSSSNNLTINGGENPGIVFTSCVASSANGDGGAIYASGNIPVSISGCEFVECAAKRDGSKERVAGGGGIAAWEVSALTVSHCSFTACYTIASGGGVMAKMQNNQIATIDHCAFNRCNGAGQGGGLAVYPKSETSATITKLVVKYSTFTNCTTGTNNGSGGAIQTYTPYTELHYVDFTSCWAGKEGGAMNDFYGGTSTDSCNFFSTLIVDHCNFTECRAENRYKPDEIQHYGGAISSRSRYVTVNDSTFTDCVSTLREGGALYCHGRESDSWMTVTNTTFTRCSAKEDGGALFSAANVLTITDSTFTDCQSLSAGEPGGKKNKTVTIEGGGAIIHRRGVGGGTPRKTNITGTTFQNCGAVGNGGAVWTQAKDEVTITDCTITGCTAEDNGGGVYLAKNGTNQSNGTISGGTIMGCQATNGGAVYHEGKVIYSGVSVTGNTATDPEGGAIAVTTAGTMYFEGNVIVKDNFYSGDSDTQHNVVLSNNNNTTIYTTEKGLSITAEIGVYAVDSINERRGQEEKDFGTYNSVKYLNAFVNDRNGLYGYQKSAEDKFIYWGFYVCKITDAAGNTLKNPDGTDAIYPKLSLAFDAFTLVTDDNGESGKAVYVKMLVENYQLEGEIRNFPGVAFTLTTASTSDSPYPYRGTEDTFCTLHPNGSQLFKLDNASTTFQLENITLDGRATEGSYRLIQASSGAVVINRGTTLQYGNAEKGGAIYAEPGSTVTVNGDPDPDARVTFSHCTATEGGAIYADTLTVTNSGTDRYGTAFIECTAEKGGAVCADGDRVDITGILCQNCHCDNEGGAIYHKNENTASSTSITDSKFTNCHTGYGDLSLGGAVNSKAETLTVANCTFSDCYTKLNGGAINHGSGDANRVQTTITDTTFTNCQTTGDINNYGYGGSVYTQAKVVEMSGCTVENSKASNNGGALYCQNNTEESQTTISGTSFENCSVTLENGKGGAIYSQNNRLTIRDKDGEKSTIDACTAPGYSGAVHMASGTLDISGNTKISSCYANKGGAIYLASGVTMNLTGSPEFTWNGRGTLNNVKVEEGACIYLAERSTLYLSGSPKFSFNNITNKPKVPNGSIWDFVRQDIYLAGYGTEQYATSIRIAGELTGDTIWVWPECAPHKLANQQFAVVKDNSISDATLNKFRNALSDEETNCSHGEYLAGVYLNGDTGNAYWDKMYNISFKKKDNKAVPVAGAEFTIYKDRAFANTVAVAVSADGETTANAQGELLDKGMVDFVSIPVGVYYMRETQQPESFKPNNVTYLLLVGTPSLSPSDNNGDIWHNGGPLDVNNAATLVERYTTNSGKYYGIFPLDADGKAVLKANLASANVGIENIRNDYEASFKKVDKIDSSGRPLPGAVFTLYVPTDESPATYENGYPKLTEWKRDANDDPTSATSADGTSNFKNLSGQQLQKGLVYFRELPKGTYYLMETEYPVRDGSGTGRKLGKLCFYVESDRVFRLEIKGEEGFTMSEWDAETEGHYKELSKDNGLYVIGNTEAVCKLTDASNNLLYELGRDGLTLIPAIYATLEEGFAAAQTHVLLNRNGEEVANDTTNPALKLMVLKDFTLTQPVTYNSSRPLTFTTAAKSNKDPYYFVTTHSQESEKYRAEIKRDYNEATDDGALITVSGGASLTLENINLNGQKSSHSGRALRVTSGTLNVNKYTLIQNFKTDGDGGAVRMDDDTTLTINAGIRQSEWPQFSYNEAANGGALSLGENCNVSISNAQFTNNIAADNGGAINVPDISVTLTNAVFTSNRATNEGGAIYAGAGASVTVTGGTISGNSADATNGGAINVENDTARLYFGGSPTVYDNKDSNGQQKNVVLHVPSNDVINTTGSGLTDGQIGVYVTGEISGELFQKYGRQNTSFGTFGDSDTRRNNAKFFTNDRNAKLYGTKKDDTNKIYWIPYVGNLKVTKTVKSDFATDMDIAFKFNVTLGDSTINGTYGDMTFKNGVANPFTLQHGESKTATELPIDLDGGYTVEEIGYIVEENIKEAVAPDFTPEINIKGKGDTQGTRREWRIEEKDTTSEVTFTNTRNGIPVSFRKVDGFGKPLPNATFKLYEDFLCSVDEHIEAFSDVDGNINFTMVPYGVHYMKEEPLDGYVTDKKYLVLIGDDAWERARADNLLGEGVTKKPGEDFAIFLFSDGKAQAVPDISKFGIMNVSEQESLVILRKIGEDENGNDQYKSLEGVEFDILRWDRTIVASGTSQSNGVFWVGPLKYGTYYLHETTIPNGYAALPKTAENWFKFEVNADEVTPILHPLNEREVDALRLPTTPTEP